MIDWKPFVALVKDSRTFILTSHMRPDCDAIGSELAMAHALRSLGKEVRIVNGDGVPPHIAFIDPDHDVKVLGRDVSASDLKCDVHIVLDTSAWGQLGPLADVIRHTSARKVVIDHHVSEDDLGAITFKDTNAEATGRLVLEASDALGVTTTPAMAAAMFAAIATDTGWFRFNSVTASTFAVIARLVASGAQPSKIFAALYETNSMERLLLQGRILTNTKSDLGGLLLTSSVSLADFEETAAEQTDTEDIINRLLAVAGVQVAVLFVELTPVETKVSLRSRSAFDVSAIAEEFHGGGHRAAAGIRFPGPIAFAENEVLTAVRKAMTN
ncbi:MAG: bifunctional oligoribonuclease/PAP phosphatase NrnA [Pirellulales bacterium]